MWCVSVADEPQIMVIAQITRSLLVIPIKLHYSAEITKAERLHAYMASTLKFSKSMIVRIPGLGVPRYLTIWVWLL